MGDSTWQHETINEAKKWPESFRARLESGTWHLLGASHDAQQNFRCGAKRVLRELGVSPGDVDPVDVLLYRLKANGHHVRLSQRHKQVRSATMVTESNRAHAIIHPLGRALIAYLRHEPGGNPSSPPAAPVRDSWQAAAARKNRELRVRVSIIRAMRNLGAAYYRIWPDFVREYVNLQNRSEFRQPISPPSFQPPVFDRLNQSLEEWAKAADAAWQRDRDRFLQGSQFWVNTGLDGEIPTAKRSRGPRAHAGNVRRGGNTAVSRRIEWAAKYLVRVPLKEIAAQDGADPATVGRVAREILRAANWLEAAKAERRARKH
jgi:hypothetical protein